MKTNRKIRSANSYRCETCKREFKEASHYAKHKRGLLCHKLTKKSRSGKKSSPGSHVKESKHSLVPHKPYQCNLCGAKFCDKVNVELHLERLHRTKHPMWMENVKSGGGISCSQCQLWFADSEQLKIHQSNCHISNNINLVPYVPPQPLQPSSITLSASIPPIQTPCNPSYFSQPNYIPNFESTDAPPAPILNPSMSPLNPMQLQQPLPSNTNTYISPTLPPSQVLPSVSNDTRVSPPLNLNSSQAGFTSDPSLNQKNAANSSLQFNKGNKVIKNDVRCCPDCNWNVCAECGQKFIDVINLEMHLSKSHPNSRITLAIYLGSGFTLYHTENSTKCHKEILTNLDKSLNRKKSDNYSYVYKPSFETSDNKRNPKHNKSFLEVGQGKNIQCASCLRLFTDAEFIIHNSKDKTALCGICSFSSCSDSQVAIHMYTCHKDALPCPLQSSLDKINLSHPSEDKGLEVTKTMSNGSSKNQESGETLLADKRNNNVKISCSLCSIDSDSGTLFVEHLQTHSPLNIQCSKCKKIHHNIVDMSNHILNSHVDHVVRLKVTLVSCSDPIFYVVLVCPFLASQMLKREFDSQNPIII